MLRTGLAALLISAVAAVAGCGGGDSGDNDDAVRFTSKDVRTHFERETGVKLAVQADNHPLVEILGPPDSAAIDRYGSFTVNVAKTKGAIKALQESQIGDVQKTFENVVVEWLGNTGEDRVTYERSLAVFNSMGK